MAYISTIAVTRKVNIHSMLNFGMQHCVQMETGTYGSVLLLIPGIGTMSIITETLM